MKILLGELKDQAEELASFLEPRVGTKPTSGGSEIDIETSSIRQGVKPRHVKTYVKRFLHKAGQRKAYRVLVTGDELTIVRLEGVEEEEEEEKKKKAEELAGKPEEKKKGEEEEEAAKEEATKPEPVENEEEAPMEKEKVEKPPEAKPTTKKKEKEQQPKPRKAAAEKKGQG